MFKLGTIIMTKGAYETLNVDMFKILERYINGDWGDLCEEDKKLNEDALKYGERIFASYKDSNNIKFYVITEWDRSYTTILLPEEY